MFYTGIAAGTVLTMTLMITFDLCDERPQKHFSCIDKDIARMESENSDCDNKKSNKSLTFEMWMSRLEDSETQGDRVGEPDVKKNLGKAYRWNTHLFVLW